MEKILLIGDSIRFGVEKDDTEVVGYGELVKSKLKDKAEVYAPNDNCRFAEYMLRYIKDWMECGDFDPKEITVIHWNNGLWDALRLNGDEPLTPVNIYTYFIKRVYRSIKYYCPNARIIFATSTPIDEEMAGPDFTRRNSEIVEYNKAAVEALKPQGVEIDDLYEVSKDLGREYRADFVHFNKLGAEILADCVIRSIFDKQPHTRIMKAETRHTADVYNITQTTIDTVYPKYYPAGAVEFFKNHHRIEKVIDDIENGHVFLLTVNDKPAGTVTVKDNEICRLFVLPEFQHNGYGRQLIDFAEKMIFIDHDSIILDASLPAKQIYLDRGYVPVNYERINTPSGDYLCHDVMKKTSI